MRASRLVPVLALATAASPAFADGTQFTTIDRQDETSRAGAEISLPSIPGNADGHFTRLDGHGQYVDPESRFGGYVDMAIARFQGTNSVTGIGGLEAGVIYAPSTGPGSEVVLHAGIVLPTASASNEALGANLGGVLARLTDYYQIIPDAVSLRLGVSPVLRSGNVFARIDLGFDVNFSDSTPQSADSILRVNAGVGLFLTPTTTLAAETTNLRLMNSGNQSESQRWINTAALAVRVHSNHARPYGAVVLPLDHDSSMVLNIAATFGIEGDLR
jgi:hypothetical protein